MIATFNPLEQTRHGEIKSLAAGNLLGTNPKNGFSSFTLLVGRDSQRFGHQCGVMRTASLEVRALDFEGEIVALESRELLDSKIFFSPKCCSPLIKRFMRIINWNMKTLARCVRVLMNYGSRCLHLLQRHELCVYSIISRN